MSEYTEVKGDLCSLVASLGTSNIPPNYHRRSSIKSDDVLHRGVAVLISTAAVEYLIRCSRDMPGADKKLQFLHSRPSPELRVAIASL